MKTVYCPKCRMSFMVRQKQRNHHWGAVEFLRCSDCNKPFWTGHVKESGKCRVGISPDRLSEWGDEPRRT